MPIKVSCPCGFSGQVVDDYAGRQVRCVKCDGVVQVPNADGLIPAAAASAIPTDAGPKLQSEAAREVLWAMSVVLGFLSLAAAPATGLAAIGGWGFPAASVAVFGFALGWSGDDIARRVGRKRAQAICSLGYSLCGVVGVAVLLFAVVRSSR